MMISGNLNKIQKRSDGVWINNPTEEQLKFVKETVEVGGETKYLIEDIEDIGFETLDDLFKSFGKSFTKLDEKAQKKAVNRYYDTIVEEYGDSLPDLVTAPIEDTVLDDQKYIQRFIENSFDVIMGQRTDNASRSPVFRQAYWRAVYDLLPRMTPAMRTILLEGKTYRQGGKTIKVGGARKSNIPNENLLNSIKADIGITPEKLRKREVEINLDMFERRVKELNDADAKLG